MLCLSLFVDDRSILISNLLVLLALLVSALDALFTQHLGATHEKRTHVSTEKAHILGLHRRHAQQVLRICQVGVELGQLRVQVRVLPVFVGQRRVVHRGAG